MKIISIFNNKGGVGKTTLTHHLAHILAYMGKKVLIMDLDPQCNISLYNMKEDVLEEIWDNENEVIDNGIAMTTKKDTSALDKLLKTPRTIHFILMPTQEGESEFDRLPPPVKLTEKLHLIPGRLTLYEYEHKISDRWSGIFLGESQSIRTITSIRNLAERYYNEYDYDFIIIDTSPNLGMLNKIIVSTVDGFLIPCLPDMLSLYGIKNIGQALTRWKREFDTCYSILTLEKRQSFPENFVRFLGYTIYNAKLRSDASNNWKLAQAHYNYAQKVPNQIEKYITQDVRNHLQEEVIKAPIGGTAVMHTHNTYPNMAQKYKKPIWELPDISDIEAEDADIKRNKDRYSATKSKYKEFALQFLERIKTLDD